MPDNRGNAWTINLIFIAAILGTLLTIWSFQGGGGFAWTLLLIEVALFIGSRLDRSKNGP
jgi:hypothetical protein